MNQIRKKITCSRSDFIWPSALVKTISFSFVIFSLISINMLSSFLSEAARSFCVISFSSTAFIFFKLKTIYVKQIFRVLLGKRPYMVMKLTPFSLTTIWLQTWHPVFQLHVSWPYSHQIYIQFWGYIFHDHNQIFNTWSPNRQPLKSLKLSIFQLFFNFKIILKSTYLTKTKNK